MLHQVGKDLRRPLHGNMVVIGEVRRPGLYGRAILHRLRHLSKGTFPDAVTQAVQYGSTVQTWASYFTNHHHIPVERTTEIFADLVQHRVSEATVLKASEELSAVIEPSTAAVKELLRDSEVLHV